MICLEMKMTRFTFVTKVDVPQVDVVPELLPVTWTFLVLRLVIVHTEYA